MGLADPTETPDTTPHSELGINNTVEAQHLARLVFLSYRFSQGGIGTQNRILTYVNQNFHPDFMTDERSPEIHERAARMIGPFFLNQRLHPATAIPWDDDSPDASKKTDQLVVNELAGLFDRFKDRDYMSGFEHDPASIAASIIVMDADYLARPGGRGGDSKPLKIVVSPYKRDPYDSLFIKHGVLGTDTNTPEFNHLFEEISSENVIRQLDTHTINSLLKVVSIYVDQHPAMAREARIIALQNLCQELQDARQ
jgi:hypothetical protein